MIVPQSKQPENTESRLQTVESVPFFLRSWWLRDYQVEADMIWQQPNWLTLPVFSTYSDPVCDAGNVDSDL